MKKTKSKKLTKKLCDIESGLVFIASMLEVLRDSCLQNDYTNQELILKMILKKHYAIIETISLMY